MIPVQRPSELKKYIECFSTLEKLNLAHQLVANETIPKDIWTEVIELCFGLEISCCSCNYKSGKRFDIYPEKVYSLDDAFELQQVYDNYMSYFKLVDQHGKDMNLTPEEFNYMRFEFDGSTFARFEDFVCYNCIKKDAKQNTRVYIDKTTIGEDDEEDFFYLTNMMEINFNRLVFQTTTERLMREDIPEHGAYDCYRCRAAYNFWDEDCVWDQKMKICVRCNKMICKEKCINDKFPFLINKKAKNSKSWTKFEVTCKDREDETQNLNFVKNLWFCDQCNGNKTRAKQAVEELNNGILEDHFISVYGYYDTYYLHLVRKYQDFELVSN